MEAPSGRTLDLDEAALIVNTAGLAWHGLAWPGQGAIAGNSWYSRSTAITVGGIAALIILSRQA